jgi:hypothetical protein
MVIDTQITIYKDIFSKEPHYISVRKALERIQRGQSAPKINEIRSKIDKERADNLKRNLPCVCFSAKFNGPREDKTPHTHSGFMVLDFDQLDDAQQFRDDLRENAFIFACWISPRGNGVKALVRIAKPESHREHFAALQDEFNGLLDKSGVNVSRVCYESYDPDIYINEGAEIYKKIKKSVVIEQQIVNTDHSENFKKLVSWLSNKREAFVKGERNIFIYKLSCACARFGIPEAVATNLIVANYVVTTNDFTVKECEQTVRSAYKSVGGQYGSAQFTNGKLVEISTTKEVEVERHPDFYDKDVKVKDVIYGEDVREAAISIYRTGYEKVLPWGIPLLDKHFKRKRKELTLLSGIGNYGKALCIETEIPTAAGFKRMADIEVGDIVFDENGNFCNVINATEVMYDRPCYKITFNDGSVVVCDEQHLWLTKMGGNAKASVVTTKYIFETLESVHVIEKLDRIIVIVACEKVDSVPVKCIEVDSPNKLFLCTRNYIPTHNSTFWKSLYLIRSVKFGEKWAIFGPEDNPAEEFYHEICEALLGAECTPFNPNKPPEVAYERAYDFVTDHFFYVYPESVAPTPEYIKERFLELIIKEGVDGVLIDPFNQLANDYGARSDKYLETILSDFMRFGQQNNVYFDIIAHPKALRKDGNLNYPMPDVFDIADGAMWNNKMHNIVIYHRPRHQEDPNDPTCEVAFKKIKKQKITGVKGTIEIELYRPTRRYLFDGVDVLQQAIDERKEQLKLWEAPKNTIHPNQSFLRPKNEEAPF